MLKSWGSELPKRPKICEINLAVLTPFPICAIELCVNHDQTPQDTRTLPRFIQQKRWERVPLIRREAVCEFVVKLAISRNFILPNAPVAFGKMKIVIFEISFLLFFCGRVALQTR